MPEEEAYRQPFRIDYERLAEVLAAKKREPELLPGITGEERKKFFEERAALGEKHITPEDRPLPDDPAYD